VGVRVGQLEKIEDGLCQKRCKGFRRMTNFDYDVIQVECYSGYKANERPVAFLYQGERLR